MCTARFGELNDIIENLYSQNYTSVQLVGIGKTDHLSSLDNWTDGNNASVCVEESPYSTWVEWGASQRDLYLLDHEGNLILHQNVSGGIPDNLESSIIDLINQISDDNECIDGEFNNDDPCNPLECIDGTWIQIVIDCAEQMGIPCEGGVYVPPAEGECCSECILTGDLNGDDLINVIDVVIVVNIALGADPGDVNADINNDGIVNVLDIVLLVSMILG
tara:strand:+ start:148 stop:804 length:657 start_codon:yes stop_codon:yes gene_type:complete